MINKIIILLFRLPINLKMKVFGLALLFFFSAFLELLGVGSIMPFVAVIANPDMIMKYDLFKNFFHSINIYSRESLILGFGLISFFIICIVNIFKLFTLRTNLRITCKISNFFATSLFTYYINKDYIFHTQNNSATLREKVISESNRVAQSIHNLLVIFSCSIICAFLIVALLIMDFSIALITTVLITLTYGFCYKIIRNRIKNNSEIISKEGYTLSKLLNESYNGIRDVKLSNKESKFCSNFRHIHDKRMSAIAESQFLSSAPKFFFEIFSFATMLTIIFFMMHSVNDINTILPIMSVYGMTTYRLLPSFQKIFSQYTIIKSLTASFEYIFSDLCKAINHDFYTNSSTDRISFGKKISINNASFTYPGANTHAVKNVQLSIHKNENIGFVGQSGSGKTTLLDIILGLLRPEEGSILIDDTPLSDSNRYAWFNRIGFVPQMIFIADTSIAENIAFGEFGSEMDMAQVKKAASLADISDFIEGLPKGYSTVVGERGTQLSGGQRQRIGIARALYKEPDILLFDEATSSLDGITEATIIDATLKFSHKKTIVMVAHRITTVRNCDIIYFFREGELIDSGTYDNLLKNNEDFRKLANAQNRMNT